MPINLPQLCRREFLRRAGLAGAAVAAPLSGYANLFGKTYDPHTFAFFSDCHIAAAATWRHAGVNMAENLAACARELVAWPVKPAALFVNGDLAYKFGSPAEYATFRNLIQPLRALAPVHLTLGNHDEREHFWQAFPGDAEQLKAVPQKQTAVYASDRANWFMLDSLEQTRKTPGKLGMAQLDWLDRELAARPDKPAMVVLHHCPDVTGLFGLKDTPALEAVFARRRQVKAFVFGHTHAWGLSQPANGVHQINLPPTGYVFQPDRPSGWVRMTLMRDGLEVELRSLDPTHPDHGRVRLLKWRGA